ncbi:hypothetical protein GVX82_01820 [Patescibacteria group bacterium]|nr:hypothetical protein [Patescibacteria group bacterium]
MRTLTLLAAVVSFNLTTTESYAETLPRGNVKADASGFGSYDPNAVVEPNADILTMIAAKVHRGAVKEELTTLELKPFTQAFLTCNGLDRQLNMGALVQRLSDYGVWVPGYGPCAHAVASGEDLSDVELTAQEAPGQVSGVLSGDPMQILRERDLLMEPPLETLAREGLIPSPRRSPAAAAAAPPPTIDPARLRALEARVEALQGRPSANPSAATDAEVAAVRDEILTLIGDVADEAGEDTVYGNIAVLRELLAAGPDNLTLPQAVDALWVIREEWDEVRAQIEANQRAAASAQASADGAIDRLDALEPRVTDVEGALDEKADRDELNGLASEGWVNQRLETNAATNGAPWWYAWLLWIAIAIALLALLVGLVALLRMRKKRLERIAHGAVVVPDLGPLDARVSGVEEELGNVRRVAQEALACAQLALDVNFDGVKFDKIIPSQELEDLGEGDSAALWVTLPNQDRYLVRAVKQKNGKLKAFGIASDPNSTHPDTGGIEMTPRTFSARVAKAARAGRLRRI